MNTHTSTCLVLGLSLASGLSAAPAFVRVPAPGDGADALPVLTDVRDRIRKMPAADKAQGVVVELGAGVWRMSDALKLDSSDSGREGAPIVWRGVPGTVLTTARELPLSTFAPVTDEAMRARFDPSVRDCVRVADVSALKLKPLDLRRELHLQPLPVPQVFCGGKWMPCARWPDSEVAENARESAWSPIEEILEKGASDKELSHPENVGKGGLFRYKGDRPARWKHLEDVYLQGFWCFDWWESTIPVAAVDVTNRTIRLKYAHCSGLKQGNTEPRRWRVMHLAEELDRPGEFWFDLKAGRLYFYPPAGARSVSVVTGGGVFTVVGAHDLALRGFTVAEANLFLYADRVTRFAVEDVTAKNLVGSFGYVQNAQDCAFRRCTVAECGRGGLSVKGGDRKTLAPGRNVIEDCRVTGFARRQLCYANGLGLGGVGNAMRHCLVADALHQGVSVGGNENVVEYCVFSNLVACTDDAGAIYKGYNPSARGNVFRRNCFVDIGSPRGRGVNAVYFDDGDIGETVEECVFVRAGHYGGTGGKAAVYSHGGYSNVVRNCIFVDCKRALGCSPWDDVRWANHVTNVLTKRVTVEVDVRKEPYASRYPDFAHFFDVPPTIPRDNLAVGSVFVRCGQVTRGPWVTNGTDVVFADDPGFVDAAHGNYALRPDSPVYRALPDFPKIPFGEIGPRTKRDSDASAVRQALDGLRATEVEVWKDKDVTVATYTLEPTPVSRIRCAVALPAAKNWNGRLRGFGSGGKAGKLEAEGVINAARRGYVGAFTDLGSSMAPNLTRENLVDFGHRATHLMTVSAKRLAEAVYGRRPDYSYFSGESTGGGQGFHEMLRYPEDYDGILSGVPAFRRLALHTYFHKTGVLAAKFTNAEKKAVDEAAIAHYADKDEPWARGRFLTDTVWNETDGPAILDRAEAACPSLKTPEKRAALESIFRGQTVNGKPVYSGMPLSGLEKAYFCHDWIFDWILNAEGGVKKSPDLTDDDLARILRAYAEVFDADGTDVSAFVKRGGKMICWGGAEDSVVPAPPMAEWFKAVKNDGALRFYLLPGRWHNHGRGIQELVDPQTVLERWVEKGAAPGALPGRFADGTTRLVAPLRQG